MLALMQHPPAREEIRHGDAKVLDDGLDGAPSEAFKEYSIIRADANAQAVFLVVMSWAPCRGSVTGYPDVVESCENVVEGH